MEDFKQKQKMFNKLNTEDNNLQYKNLNEICVPNKIGNRKEYFEQQSQNQINKQNDLNKHVKKLDLKSSKTDMQPDKSIFMSSTNENKSGSHYFNLELSLIIILKILFNLMKITWS